MTTFELIFCGFCLLIIFGIWLIIVMALIYAVRRRKGSWYNDT